MHRQHRSRSPEGHRVRRAVFLTIAFLGPTLGFTSQAQGTPSVAPSTSSTTVRPAPGEPTPGAVAFKEFVSGQSPLPDGKISWHVERGARADGAFCWRFRAKPRPRMGRLQGPGNSYCAQPPDAGGDAEERVQVVAWNAPRSPYGVLVVLTPRSVPRARLGFARGRNESLRAARPGVLVYAGDKIPLITQMKIGKTIVNCAAGGILNFADLKDDVLAKPAVGAPYGCLPG